MSAGIERRHARFLAQAAWTAPLRAFLLKQFDLNPLENVLEIGCGTGALLIEDGTPGKHLRLGLDLDFPVLDFASNQNSSARFVCADGLSLPFQESQFDLIFCHYFLLWVKNPLKALQEMRRCTRRGGVVAVFAEPAYSARLDYPSVFQELGNKQTIALASQGANTDIGLRLPRLFTEAGFQDAQYGQSGFQVPVGQIPVCFDSEWETLFSDLAGVYSTADLNHLREMDRTAWLDGSRVLQIPTFYAFSCVP